MRVAFLIDEDQVPQARPAIMVCSALMRNAPWINACIIAANDQVADDIRWRYGDDKARSVELFVFQESWIDSLLGRMGSSTYRKNLDFFRSLDALVIFDSRPLILKTRYGLDHIKIIRWIPDIEGVAYSEMTLFLHTARAIGMSSTGEPHIKISDGSDVAASGFSPAAGGDGKR